MNKKDLKPGNFYVMRADSEEHICNLYISYEAGERALSGGRREKPETHLLTVNDVAEGMGIPGRVDDLPQFNWDRLEWYASCKQFFYDLEKKVSNE